MSRSALKLVVFVIVVAALAFLKEQRHLTSVTSYHSALSKGVSSAGDANMKSPPFRILLGIFIMDHDKDMKKRTLIKNTYLSFPKFLDRYNVTTMSRRFTDACSLHEYWQGNQTQKDECQLLYTFVVGAAKNSDPKATKEYLNLEEDRPMTVDPSKIPRYLSDITYLNIIENMNDGKSPTWFKYASTQIPDDLGIDLIAKVDSDCVVYPPELIAQIELIRRDKKIHYPLRNIYGGSRQRGKDLSYMQGGFYFMSKDVARWITSDKCDRERIIQEYMPEYKDERAEDVEISRFVRSHPEDIVEMEIPRGAAYDHEGKLKQGDHFRDRWKWYIATIVARDRIKKVQLRTNMTCPPGDALDEERTTIDQEFVRMLQRFDLLRKQLREKCENLNPSQ